MKFKWRPEPKLIQKRQTPNTSEPFLALPGHLSGYFTYFSLESFPNGINNKVPSKRPWRKNVSIVYSLSVAKDCASKLNEVISPNWRIFSHLGQPLKNFPLGLRYINSATQPFFISPHPMGNLAAFSFFSAPPARE